MNIDQQIQQALSDEVKDIIDDNHAIDANPFKQMQASFKGQMGWMYKLVMFFTTLFVFGAVYCGYQFYQAQAVKPLMAWGIGVIIFVLVTQISKMWYWSEMGNNRVIRELKVLELQVAQIQSDVQSEIQTNIQSESAAKTDT